MKLLRKRFCSGGSARLGTLVPDACGVFFVSLCLIVGTRFFFSRVARGVSVSLFHVGVTFRERLWG